MKSLNCINNKTALFFSLIMLACTNVHAKNADVCDKDEYNYVHCLYSKDAFKNNNGNYVLMTIVTPNGQEIHDPQAFCVGYGWDMEMFFKEDIKRGLKKSYFQIGQNSIKISVCADKDCRQSQLVATDQYVINKSSDQSSYIVSPETYGFKLAGVYPAIDCNQANQSLMAARHAKDGAHASFQVKNIRMKFLAE